jgi:hypothetical protein
VQKLRMKIRQNSLEIWRNKPDTKVFDEAMKIHLLRLKFATDLYHKITRVYDYRKAINRRIRILTSKLKQI